MPETPEQSPRQRLFFALWPDGRTREALAGLQAALPVRGGRPMRVENIHLTLAFVGETDADTRDCLIRQAGSLRLSPLRFRIERLGYFPRPRVLWAGPRQTPEALAGLVAALNAALAPCGYVPEARPFRAHVTLFRKVVRAPRPLAFEPIEWPVTDLCLVESVPEAGGVRYAVIARFPLTG
ncbi:MAG: RNA 2',3'-cyclic phosphodiesterase [Chromatiales bacterium]|nr:RNA 2',3'-cyclic phosphodiesterase [Chromatiales bacterium]